MNGEGEMELDLSDSMVLEAADLRHTPREFWRPDGQLTNVSCDECGQKWPCPTRQAIREIRERQEARAKHGSAAAFLDRLAHPDENGGKR